MAFLDLTGLTRFKSKLDTVFKKTQTAVSDPSASGTATAFISGITQNAQGVITPSKKNLPSASTSNAGIVQLNNTFDSTSTTQAATASTVASLNDNIVNLQEGIAIIVDGDTASVAVPVGGYAYVKNNTHGLADGLYKNTSSSAFPVSGGTANSTVFTTVPTGAVNALNSKIAWKLLYYNNGSTVNALNLDLAKYTMLLFKNNYGESFVICQQANANGAYFATTSRFYTSSIPVVMFQYELKINNDATGIYIDQNESKQININSDGTIQIYPYSSEFDFVRVYGAQIQ